jgi:hypothetical protein
MFLPTPAPVPFTVLTPAALGFIQAHTEPDLDHTADDECPICLDGYTEELCLRIIGVPGCVHRVGRSCLNEMLSNRPGDEKRCPLCRPVWIPVTRFWRSSGLPLSFDFYAAPTRLPRGPIDNLDVARVVENAYDRQVDSFNRLTQDIELVRARARETSRTQRRNERARRRSNRVVGAETGSATVAARFMSSFAGASNRSDTGAVLEEGRDETRNHLPTRTSSLINPVSARQYQNDRNLDARIREGLQAPAAVDSDILPVHWPRITPSNARTRTSTSTNIPLALQRSEIRRVRTTAIPRPDHFRLQPDETSDDTDPQAREVNLAFRELALQNRGIRLERREAALNERENALNARDRGITTRRAELERREGLARRQRREMEELIKRHREEVERLERE